MGTVALPRGHEELREELVLELGLLLSAREGEDVVMTHVVQPWRREGGREEGREGGGERKVGTQGVRRRRRGRERKWVRERGVREREEK